MPDDIATLRTGLGTNEVSAGGLGGRPPTAIQGSAAVGRMTAYIAEHLREPITARDLARAAGYSQFHAARLFREQTGLAPFEYLRRARLTASAHALRAGGRKVLDVALDFVFDSHSGFTRAFTNGFGISPRRYAAQPAPDGWLIPYRYLNRNQPEEPTMNQTTVIFTQIVDRPARKLICKLARQADDYFSYVTELGCGENNNSEPWEALVQIPEALYEPVGVWLPDELRPVGAGKYAHGVEVPADNQGPVPDGFTVIDLPGCQLLVFQGEPYNDEDFETAVGACMERIETFNPEVYGYQYAPALAPRMQLNPQGWRGYIELRPVTACPR